MKIAINLLPFHSKIGGVGKYAKNLIIHLSQLDKNNEYYLFTTKIGEHNFINLNPNFHLLSQNFDNSSSLKRILWEQLVLPFQLYKLKVDFLFTPSVAIPILFYGKMLTTIHDIAYKREKKKYPLLRRLYIKIITSLAIRKSLIIFTVSNFSKKEIITEFNIPENKIIVTYNGVSEEFLKQYSSYKKDLFLQKYQLNEGYILYAGAVEPGKNIDKLILGFKEFLELNEKNKKINLVLTSGVGWQKEKVFKFANYLSVEENIHFLPYLSDNEMPLLYQNATMLIYLSDYEGFGLPVLEALASGIPVLTSTSSAILEFSGEAIMSVEPTEQSLIASTINKIIYDIDLRKHMIHQGFKIAKDYSWSKSAKVFFETINRNKIINV